MQAQHVLPIRAESFVLLVKQLKKHINEADVFEIDLDNMRVKGDLAVINKFFNKPMIAKAGTLDLLKRGVKSGMTFAEMPYNMDLDLEFHNLVKNKGSKVIHTYTHAEETPSLMMLKHVFRQIKENNPDYIKIVTYVEDEESATRLLSLFDEVEHGGRLIIHGTGPYGKYVCLRAPLKGSNFYYAHVDPRAVKANEWTKNELVDHWESLE